MLSVTFPENKKLHCNAVKIYVAIIDFFKAEV